MLFDNVEMAGLAYFKIQILRKLIRHFDNFNYSSSLFQNIYKRPV